MTDPEPTTITAVYIRNRTLVFATSGGEVHIPLPFVWAAADLYASLAELVEARKTMSERTGRAWEGTDGRYRRAVAALAKADGSEGTQANEKGT